MTADKNVGKTIRELQEHVLSRGVYISKIKEQGFELTYDESLKIKEKEVLTLEGPADAVNALASKMGKKLKIHLKQMWLLWDLAFCSVVL